MVLWLNMVLAPRMIWENKREPLAKFLNEPEASNLPQNTVLSLSRIPTKHNSGMWSYSDENCARRRITLMAKVVLKWKTWL